MLVRSRIATLYSYKAAEIYCSLACEITFIFSAVPWPCLVSDRKNEADGDQVATAVMSAIAAGDQYARYTVSRVATSATKVMLATSSAFFRSAYVHLHFPSALLAAR